MKQIYLALIVMFSALGAHAADLAFCGGAPGGAYTALATAIGNDIVRKTGGNLEVLETSGSMETAEMLRSDDCVMGIMQADAVTSAALPRDIDVSDAHIETVFWIYGKTAGAVKTFAGMAEESNLAKGVAYVAGSGPEITLKNFAKQSEEYGKVKLVPFSNWFDAAKAAKQGFVMKSGVRVEIGGLLYVGRSGLINDDIASPEFRDELYIGSIGEDAFTKLKDKNGNQLYTECKVDSDGDTGIKTQNKMWSIAALCMHAQVVVNNEWINGLPAKEARTVGRTVSKAIQTNVLSVRQ